MAEIRFGTDGWRAVIAEDYTFENVRAVAQATAGWLLRTGQARSGAVVGYDTRFLSDAFANAAAEVLAANGIAVALASRAAPTPALSHAVLDRKAAAGVVITASHNPGRWNGFKVKQAAGNSAPPEVTSEIEQAVPAILDGAGARGVANVDADARSRIERFDPNPPYLASLREFVDLERIREAGLRVAVDSMYGAAGGLTAAAIGEGATSVHELHGERNPAFPGMRAPEPIAPNLGALMRLLEGGGHDVGLATDGDGDRFGLVDEQGRFLNQLQVFALLVRYLLEVRSERGAIVRSITTTRMVDLLGERHDCPVFETPVGFKHLGPRMIDEDAIVAGEESGGYAFRGHIPERDGVLSGLLLLDYMVQTGKPASQLLAELYDELGPHEYDRVDVTLREEERDAIAEQAAAATPSEIAGLRVVSRDTLDGYRFTLEGGWWLLMRFSGTEPLLRIYAELPSADQVRRAIEQGQALAGVTL
ncbi:MAG: phosphoglucomutase/phosphomannomutase family protein [Chloroflexi bacterium]|nr:phosphoglucomutase/phosphomannomutase family protein [Chloroflexota bacterium]